MMSPSKRKSLFIGLFAAIVIALSGSVMAQDYLRLWKPYGPDSFGGGRRGNDGVYASVSGIYWSISAPKGGYIGATTTKGKDETRFVYSVNTSALREQTNSLKINMMEDNTTLGTRFEVGNRRGHHGWLVTGYGLPGQSHSMTAQNVSMTIRDEGQFAPPSGVTTFGNQASIGYLWGPNYGTVQAMDYVLAGPAPANTIGYVPNPATGGYTYYRGTLIVGDVLGVSEVWGFVPVGTPYYRPEMVERPGDATYAPLPIGFDDVSVNMSSQHLSAELMYTYRLNPFTWGGMELLAGARYWDFDDKFGLVGVNEISVSAAGVITTYGPIRAFENMVVDARGQNRVFGPQIGMKLTRHNARWTFGAEGRLAAGINSQIVKTKGYITPHRAYTPVGMGDVSDLGVRTNDVNFGHRKNTTVFSPIGELRLTADWQWTNAVSFFGALDGMFAGNIARGVRVTDYVVSNDQIFGIRGNDRNTTVLVYGVEAGIKVHR